MTLAAARGQTPSPYDALAAAYAPYLSADDAFEWPMKVRSLSGGEYRFWRGSKDLFFGWAKSACADWLADADAFVPSHADLHFGNLGTYASDEAVGKLAFGMVDFDDACALPFQIELLEGFITTRLVVRTNHLDAGRQNEVDEAMLDAYRSAARSGKSASELLRDEPRVAKMIARDGTQTAYAEIVRSLCKDGVFRRTVGNGKTPKEVLRPLDASRFHVFAQALIEARKSDAGLAALLPNFTADELRSHVQAVAQRTRIGSSGSQGLRKYLILLKLGRSTLGGSIGDDVIVYLKEEIPTAAERAGVVPRDATSPGERQQRLSLALTRPRALVNAFATLEGRPYWVSLKEPWSDELDADNISTAGDLIEYATIWGTVAGAAVGANPRAAQIVERIDASLRTTLCRRAEAYVEKQAVEFDAFSTDARASAAVGRAEAALQASQADK